MATNKDDGIRPMEVAHPPSPPPDIGTKASKWFDTMIVGYTGQGKSTTADKMILASSKTCHDPNPPPLHEAGEKKATTNTDEAEAEIRAPRSLDSKENDKGVPSSDENEVRSKNPEDVIRYKNGIAVKDLLFWTVGGIDEIKEEPIILYLKQLALYRTIDDPHLSVNNYRKMLGVNSFTTSCQLISNEVTKVRVLDVPGFFSMQSSNQPSRSSIEDASENCTRGHLAVMREIIRIQYAVEIKFNRILYFLPVRGPLEKASEVLNQELLTLVRYFGKSIFESMVIVATAPSRVSGRSDMRGKLFVEEDIEVTREHFRVVLKNVLPLCTKETLPNPPIIFISMLDECEEIVEKVRGAKVAQNSLELSFDPGVCIKCPCSIEEIEGERLLCIPKGNNKITSIHHDESTCHPLFIPEHSELEDIDIVNGVKNIVLKRNLHDPSIEEVCHKCNKSPGSSGCMQVGTTHEINIKGKLVQIPVDHTNMIEKHRTLSQFGSDDEDDPPSDEDRGGEIGSCPSEAIENDDPTAEIVVHGGVRSKKKKGRRDFSPPRKQKSLLEETGVAISENLS